MEDLQNKQKECCGVTKLKPYLSVILVLISAFFLAVQNWVIKSITYISATEFLFMRYISTFIFNFPALVKRDRQEIFNKSKIFVLAARGITCFTSIYLGLTALKLMPMAEVAVISSTSAAWVMVLSRMILKEKFDLLSSLSVLLAMFGLVLMSRVFTFISDMPSERYTDPYYWYGFASALSCILVGSFSIVALRKLKDVHESISLAYFSAIGMFGGTIVLIILKDLNLPPCGLARWKILLFGFLAYSDVAIMTIAIRYDKAGAVWSCRVACEVIFMFIFQIAVFNDKPDVYTISAAIVVLISLLLAGLRKHRQQKCFKRPEPMEHSEVATRV